MIAFRRPLSTYLNVQKLDKIKYENFRRPGRTVETYAKRSVVEERREARRKAEEERIRDLEARQRYQEAVAKYRKNKQEEKAKKKKAAEARVDKILEQHPAEEVENDPATAQAHKRTKLAMKEALAKAREVNQRELAAKQELHKREVEKKRARELERKRIGKEIVDLVYGLNF